MHWIKYILFSVLLFVSCTDDEPGTIMDDILAGGDKNLRNVIAHKDKYEVQILFSPIRRIGDSIIMEDHFFNFRPDEYFYPASTVKMPVAFLALQKLEELRSIGIDIDRNTRVSIDSLRPMHIPVVQDSTSESTYPSIGHYIEKLFAVSDNDAYNRLYEFTSQDYINSHLRTKQIFTNGRIVHRVGVSGFSLDENRYTPSIGFIREDESLIYKQDPIYAQANHIFPLSKTKKGIAYMDSEGQKIKGPFDFSEKNFINIRDLQESLKRLIFPDLYPKRLQYGMSNDDREFVMQSMAKLPRGHQYLSKVIDKYYDSYVKFFLFGDKKSQWAHTTNSDEIALDSVNFDSLQLDSNETNRRKKLIHDHIEIRNKAGFAYGYLTDCAYIKDTKENIEYFLTATVHVNENQIYNDGVYEYDEVGVPFLAELGRQVHKYMIIQKTKNEEIQR